MILRGQLSVYNIPDNRVGDQIILIQGTAKGDTKRESKRSVSEGKELWTPKSLTINLRNSGPPPVCSFIQLLIRLFLPLLSCIPPFPVATHPRAHKYKANATGVPLRLRLHITSAVPCDYPKPIQSILDFPFQKCITQCAFSFFDFSAMLQAPRGKELFSHCCIPST